jgi:two-component system, sensor histidine kinase and response regulator
MSAPVSTAIDESVLDGYRALQDEGQPDVVTEFIDVFLEDLPSRVARIAAAVAAQNPQEIRSAAHALKGSAASIGAVRLSSLAGDLEAIGRAMQIEGAVELVPGIEAEAVTATEVLRTLRR